jgi:hypothetical protein
MLQKLNLKSFRALSLIFIIGCFPHKKRLMGETFEYTGSPCIDGVVLNISAASCENMYTGSMPEIGGLKFRCTDSEEANMWTSNRFIIIPHDVEMISDSWQPFCQDSVGTIYIEVN